MFYYLSLCSFVVQPVMFYHKEHCFYAEAFATAKALCERGRRKRKVHTKVHKESPKGLLRQFLIIKPEFKPKSLNFKFQWFPPNPVKPACRLPVGRQGRQGREPINQQLAKSPPRDSSLPAGR